MLFSVIDDLRWTDEHKSGARVCDRRNRKTDLVLDRILLFFAQTQNQDGRKFARDDTFGDPKQQFTDLFRNSKWIIGLVR
jgi:hypothetical protein